MIAIVDYRAGNLTSVASALGFRPSRVYTGDTSRILG